ncbi:helix-turn-helix domain-containing protein [Rhizobium alvei]|uniref:Helix-turn-helix transcriptional regulator n=1 Tax=Rhizobium alvei TaxID=1132659 RepID=A0ABT8YTM6_9HYPH|nr:helix-turn-helix transcriptional regulator [Rhizobium alvei]MDO6967099.1 helix-turn-helix transcriptional regulator [Rhizobium alvei]
MSFQFDLDPKDEAAAEFIGAIGHRLQELLVERKALDNLTQQEIANRLGVDRARVNKCFSGYNNLTLRSLAELVWALDAEIKVEMHLAEEPRGANYSLKSAPETTRSHQARTQILSSTQSAGSTTSSSLLPFARLEVITP